MFAVGHYVACNSGFYCAFQPNSLPLRNSRTSPPFNCLPTAAAIMHPSLLKHQLPPYLASCHRRSASQAPSKTAHHLRRQPLFKLRAQTVTTWKRWPWALLLMMTMMKFLEAPCSPANPPVWSLWWLLNQTQCLLLSPHHPLLPNEYSQWSITVSPPSTWCRWLPSASRRPTRVLTLNLHPHPPVAAHPPAGQSASLVNRTLNTSMRMPRTATWSSAQQLTSLWPPMRSTPVPLSSQSSLPFLLRLCRCHQLQRHLPVACLPQSVPIRNLVHLGGWAPPAMVQ